MIPEVGTLPDYPAVASICCRCVNARHSITRCRAIPCGIRWQREAVEDRAARDKADAKEKENL